MGLGIYPSRWADSVPGSLHIVLMSHPFSWQTVLVPHKVITMAGWSLYAYFCQWTPSMFGVLVLTANRLVLEGMFSHFPTELTGYKGSVVAVTWTFPYWTPWHIGGNWWVLHLSQVCCPLTVLYDWLPPVILITVAKAGQPLVICKSSGRLLH